MAGCSAFLQMHAGSGQRTRPLMPSKKLALNRKEMDETSIPSIASLLNGD